MTTKKDSLAQVVTAEVVTPGALDALARQRLEDELCEVQRRIFRGADRASIQKYLLASEAEHTWLQLYRAEGGALVGFIAVHIFEREIDGRTVAIVRTQTGVLREYRGANLVTGFLAKRVLRYRLAHPLRPLYLFGPFIHPSSYSQLVRYHDEAWPREDAETPAEILELMDALSDSFGLQRAGSSNPLVRKMPWQTIESSDDRAYWERSDRPGVQFFLRENPGYADGHGLMIFAQLSVGALTRGLVRNMRDRSQRGARKVAGRVRAGLAGLLPAPGATT